jgi:pimeloyl-ACP methyl ester carboxylesterase/DNA-binding CsgD family transcriptional regulator
MRKGFDGLAAMVQTALAANPFCGHVFVFRGRRGDFGRSLFAVRSKSASLRLLVAIGTLTSVPGAIASARRSLRVDLPPCFAQVAIEHAFALHSLQHGSQARRQFGVPGVQVDASDPAWLDRRGAVGQRAATSTTLPLARPGEQDMAFARDIRFISSSDGVQLAAARYGAGPVLIRAATWLTHIERVLPGSLDEALIEEFAPRFSYVVYDTRGCGLSQRRVDELSFESWVRDLEAVADAHGREPFTLLGFTCAAGVAVEYAARHPERVSRLILFGGFATSYHSTSHPDPAVRREGDLMLELAELGWGNDSPAFRQVFAARFLPDATLAQWRAFDERQRATATPEVAVRYLRAMYGMNVKEAATRVRCPTLVLHPTRDEMVRFEQGRRLASLIPGAQFAPLEGRNHIPFPGEPAWHGFVRETRRFLGRADERDSDASVRLTDRQREVLHRISLGESDKQIARALGLSPRTVEMHAARALQALGCRSRAEAVRRATEHCLLSA